MVDAPATYNQFTGKLKIQKGTLNQDILLYSWDVIEYCDPDVCRAIVYCTYQKSTEERKKKCAIQDDFMRGLAAVLFRNFPDLKEEVWFQIGLLMAPLYRVLCKLYITELGFPDTLIDSPMGGLKVNPIYKEIREQIKAIDNTWKSLGLSPVMVPKPTGQPIKGIGEEKKGSYYDMMESGAFGQEGKKTEKKRKKNKIVR